MTIAFQFAGADGGAAAPGAAQLAARRRARAGGVLVAQRIPRTIIWPAGRTSAVSVTGRYGTRSGMRAQRGRVDTAAAARIPYGARAISGSGGVRRRNLAASRASGVLRSSGR